MSLQLFGGLTGLFFIVYDGQHALVYTLGRARRVVGPGLHFKIPMFERYRVEETKHTTLDLEPQVIQLVDDLVYEVDCKVVYRIVNLRKALIEIDDLVTGLQNVVVIAVQKIVSSKDRHTVRDVKTICEEVSAELEDIENKWGVRLLTFGFSNISPSPTTLEVTQLELLTREKLQLYSELCEHGLPREAAVALVAGAVVSVHPGAHVESQRSDAQQEQLAIDAFEQQLEERSKEDRKKRERAISQDVEEEDPLADPHEDEEES